MARTLSPVVLSWKDMLKHWWQWFLFGLIIASATMGTVYIIFSIYIRTVKYYKTRPKKDVVSERTSIYLETVLEKLSPRTKTTLSKPSTFGVFLGDFASPPTAAQLDVCQRSELVILTPFAKGVRAAISDLESRHYLARLDLASLVPSGGNTDEAVEQIANAIFTCVSIPSFTGVLLAGWESKLSAAYLSAISVFIEAAGLLIYLETAPPTFLLDCDVLSNPAISGLVLRNASIHSNGEHRDYFDMETLQPTVRAFVKESCLRDFSVLAWETVDAGKEASNAVIKRGMQWCGFYSVVTWVGSSAALTDAELNILPIEPLGAFEWLKDEVVMEVHSLWKNIPSIAACRYGNSRDAWEEVFRCFPDTVKFLSSNKAASQRPKQHTSALHDSSRISSPTLANRSIRSISDMTSDFDGLGSCPLGVEVSPLAFAEVLQAQIRLRNLGLLHPVDTQRITNMGILFRKFHDRHVTKLYENSPYVIEAVKEVSGLARNGHLRINLGLNPGFVHRQARFWAVDHTEPEGAEVFVSRDAQGLAGTVLHTLLSSQGLSREMCFELEHVFAEWSNDLDPSGLPRRLAQDIDLLTPEERLLLLQQLSLSESLSTVMVTVRANVRQKLLDAPSRTQLNDLDSVGYLNGSVSAQDLLHARFAWYDDQGARHPDLLTAATFFDNFEKRMISMLRNREEPKLKSFSLALKAILSAESIDAWADLLGLATFCASRKAAIDEVYLEVADRNPLWNDQSDQAAVFSESFALGSRCEAYFDVAPSVFGKLLSDRYRAHYNKKQPPLWNNGAPDLATAYGGAQIDSDPNRKMKALPEFRRFTFLSVFAIPALVDIALLSTIGRGLYLSAFMSLNEQRSATIALMISLLLSGATGTWIACGGSYYLISMAFSAMNLFVLNRLIAGLAFTILGALIGFTIFAAVSGPIAGLVFMLYLIAFTTYLILFAAIASFQFPGTSFISGRKLIIWCLPWLLISPIVTIWAGHDIYIYLAVFYIVIVVLLFALRHVGSRWVTWYQDLRQTNDSEIRKWYTENKVAGDSKVLDAMTDPAALKLARSALLKDVEAEIGRGMFKKPSQDDLVLKLAADYEATNFLLDWYCRYADVPRPIPYSSSWNIQTKVALTTLSDNQKGIRLHNAFIHWRQAGDEVGCGFLYFIIALLDKWVELLTGTRLVGLSQSLNDQFRMAVGFGLAYYLIGAVLIDVKAQELHGAVSTTNSKGIRTPKELREHQKAEIRNRRAVYRRTLFRFLTWHCWGLAATTGLVWALQGSVEGMIMFLAYVGAYTGLLWYQYTKIFSGPFALKPLLTSVCIGLPVGIALKRIMPEFKFSGVIALGTATWTAAILCLCTAKIGMPNRGTGLIEVDETFHGYTKPWADPEWSQPELKIIYENLKSIPSDAKFAVTPSRHPGSEVTTILESRIGCQGLQGAFPDGHDMIDLALKAWEGGQIEIELVSLLKLGAELRAISWRTTRKIKLIVGVGPGAESVVNMRNNCQIIAELLMHEVAEAYFRMPHDHAMLAENLVCEMLPLNTRLMLVEEDDRDRVVTWSKQQTLKNQCLGLQCDTNWDKICQPTRQYFLKRCLGEVCMVSDAERQSLESVLCRSVNEDLDIHVSRCDLSIEVITDMMDFAKSRLWSRPKERSSALEQEEFSAPSRLYYLKLPFNYVFHTLGFLIKYFVTALVADPEWQREFDHALANKNVVLRVPAMFLLNCLWTYARFAQNLGLSILLFHHRPKMQELWKEIKGNTITQKQNRMVIQKLDGVSTAFKRPHAQGGFKLYHYKGLHKSEPNGNYSLLLHIATYNSDSELLIKEKYKDGQATNLFEYDYETKPKRQRLFAKHEARMPTARRCVRGPRHLETVSYNSKGFVEAGSYMTSGNLTHFKLKYRKNAQFLDELLRGEFVMAHLSCTVSWCAPPRLHAEKMDRWIPHAKVTKATFIQGPDAYESKWTYDHKFHPTVATTLNGQNVTTPPMIEHDWLGVLKKPKHSNFFDENPLFHSKGWNSNPIARFLGLSRYRVPISTSLARSRLWKAWKNGKDLDGVVVRWMDEKLCRKDKTLAPYWRMRNRGNLKGARQYISQHTDAVVASADLDEEISSWTPLAIKLGDLYAFAPGGDTILHTRAKDAGKDTNETLHVLASDNGTWPNEGGGVSACRRDMINSLETVKWHMLCESANDFGIPKHQTEQNVLSLKVIPLWGLDFLTPTHGLFKNRLDSEIDMLATSATNLEIRRNFIPTLTALVKGARAIELSSADLQQATRALVNLHDYFQDKRHWSEVWTSDVSKEAWRGLWLSQDMPNARPTTEWLDTELPTLGHFDTALELWLRYLFVFSIQVPDKVPAIFQASHHSVSAAYGVVCKVKRNCQLQIWDHAISWRETNMCLSSALCKLPPFVRNALLGLMRLTSVLVLHHADVILPCADFFNPGWEVEIGTCQGTIEHRNSFKRKISPIVNGITDAEVFQPVKEIKTKSPTVTMLSHLWFCKDLKTAILAADVIVNEWGFKDYQLDVYGSIEKAPVYSNECQELIAAKSLRGQVKLCGTANPLKVLEQTWLFLNSSLSEGLPLALGEAALTGAPVVCTDVGASLRVLSDPDNFSRYSAVVAPNDARALARAQIKLLGMLDEWSKYADDEGPTPILPFSPTAADVESITARMYEKSEHRRKLGMKTREIVQKSFSGERYLREHEQMLWIGKSRKMMETRTHGKLSNDPTDIMRTLSLNAAVNEVVIPRSAAPSLFAPSITSFAGSMYGASGYDHRSNIPAITEEWTELVSKHKHRPNSHLSIRTNSRHSIATTDTDLSTLKPTAVQVNAVTQLHPHFPSRHSSWRSIPKLTSLANLAKSDIDNDSLYSHLESPVPFSPWGGDNRFRNSDISLINIDANNSATNILTMEAPASARRSTYRNVESGRSSPAYETFGGSVVGGAHGRKSSPGFGRNSSASFCGRNSSPMINRNSSPGFSGSMSGIRSMSPGMEKMHSASAKSSPTTDKFPAKLSPGLDKKPSYFA